MTPRDSLGLSLTLKGVLFIGLCLAATPLAKAAIQTSFSSAEQHEDKAIPAVVQVYREIGLSVTGSWNHYKAKPLDSAASRDKEMGWIPGFQMNASTMFRIQNIRHLLVALHFVL
ncbi:hypothetical protein AA0472_1043 [Acetobacter estunensis NRIC 0472]|uniref:Uncharacterized protein n=1 Tax=Acetobacter estunensis TaxID=104097 RepID=A0A967BE39_9PROT|nr:hypothetical protein [Acetobacter estunensis]NHO54737.1 hypothetical protein [Acetobacter estunensis]GBQ23280.1 hypothetical protein AA0472_1043 [Acetobacter estunensis NRIC 0472]